MASSTVDSAPSLFAKLGRVSGGTQVLIAMIIGASAGVIFGERAAVVQPLGDIFIRLLLMAAIPLVFFNLVAGLTTLSDVKVLGRLGVRVLAYYTVTTLVALAIGLTVMQLLQPGIGMTLRDEVSGNFGQVPSLMQVVVDLIPRNVFQALAEGKVSQLVVFALFLGVSVLLLPAEHKSVCEKAFNAFAELFRKLVGIVLKFGPIGIGALTANTVGVYGAKLFGPLSVFIGGVWIALSVMAAVYLLVLYATTRMTPRAFFSQAAPVFPTALATCSSMATTAVSLEVAGERMKIPRRIYAFTIPLGAQINKDGTSIFLASLLLFTAQAAGVSFGFGTIVTILLLGLLLSEGSGGIPGSGIVIGLIFVKAFNLPVEIAAIVVGVYRLIDMGTTMVNCMGDLIATKIIAHYEPAEPLGAQPEVTAG